MIATNQRPYNSIIWIHVMRSDSLVICTCGRLYFSAEPSPMSFTLPRTRLVHDHLKSLSYQRLGPPDTLTTWTSLLYMSLIDSLECQDATLLESLSNYIYYNNTTIKSLQETHWIKSSSYNTHVISKHNHLMPNIWNPVPNITPYMHDIIYHTFK